MEWKQGEDISELPHAYIYSVSLWDRGKYRCGENMCLFKKKQQTNKSPQIM